MSYEDYVERLLADWPAPSQQQRRTIIGLLHESQDAESFIKKYEAGARQEGLAHFNAEHIEDSQNEEDNG